MTILSMLTPKSTTKDPREGPPGFNRLTSEEVTMAVSLLSDIDAAILLAGHIQQHPNEDQMGKILDLIEYQLYQAFKRQRLGKPDPKALEVMAECVWAEYFTNAKMSEEQRALECDIPTATWFRSYKLAYPAGFSEISSRATSAYRQVKRSIDG